MNETLHLVIDAAGWVGVALTVIFYIASNKKSAKTENDQRHAENKRKLDELLGERQYLKPHDHIETEGPLQAEGIIRRKVNGN